MAKFIIHGGKPLKGTVSIGGAKNSSFKLMIASLLADGESRLLNIAKIGEVEISKKIIEALGGQVTSPGEQSVFIIPDKLKSAHLAKNFGSVSRASIMFSGPLLARFGQARLPLPGGDQVGRRPIERHLEGLKSLGVKITYDDGFIQLRCARLKGGQYRFAKNTHTGTETMIMAACKATGKTVLLNAAQEPEIDDLINYLNKMGAKIKKLPGRRLTIVGVKKLKGTIFKAMPDRNEAVSYACAALGTKGDIIISNAKKDHLKAFLTKVEAVGGHYEIGNYGVRFWYEKPLHACKIITRPHPGFMTDWQPLWTTLMTQAQGKSQIIEAVYDQRLGFTRDLIKMGAKIKLFNPKVTQPDKFYNFNYHDDQPSNHHAAQVTGPTPLRGQNLAAADLRAGATLTLAALIAQGKSIIKNVEQIDRGYENLDARLRQLGADIKRVE